MLLVIVRNSNKNINTKVHRRDSQWEEEAIQKEDRDSEIISKLKDKFINTSKLE